MRQLLIVRMNCTTEYVAPKVFNASIVGDASKHASRTVYCRIAASRAILLSASLIGHKAFAVPSTPQLNR